MFVITSRDSDIFRGSLPWGTLPLFSVVTVTRLSQNILSVSAEFIQIANFTIFLNVAKCRNLFREGRLKIAADRDGMGAWDGDYPASLLEIRPRKPKEPLLACHITKRLPTGHWNLPSNVLALRFVAPCLIMSSPILTSLYNMNSLKITCISMFIRLLITFIDMSWIFLPMAAWMRITYWMVLLCFLSPVHARNEFRLIICSYRQNDWKVFSRSSFNKQQKCKVLNFVFLVRKTILMWMFYSSTAIHGMRITMCIQHIYLYKISQRSILIWWDGGR